MAWLWGNLVVFSISAASLDPGGSDWALRTWQSDEGLPNNIISDVTQTSEKLGKSAGKDVAAQKATYPAVIGLEASRKEAARLTRKAHAALQPMGKKAGRLIQIAEYLLGRTS